MRHMAYKLFQFAPNLKEALSGFLALVDAAPVVEPPNNG